MWIRRVLVHLKSRSLYLKVRSSIFSMFTVVWEELAVQRAHCVSAPNRPGSGLTVNTLEYWWVESELYLNFALFPLPVSWAAAGQVSVLFWPWCSADLLLLWMADALISFLLLNLALVMKLGLLCFSHYLFIKDMTRKWGCHGDGSTKSPSCMPSCIVYSSAKSAVLNRKRKDFPAPSSLFLSSVVQTMTHKHSSLVILLTLKDFISLLSLLPKWWLMLHRGVSGGGWGRGNSHRLQVVICTEEIKDDGIEPFGLNDSELHVCRGDCPFPWASPGRRGGSLSLELKNMRIK